MCKTESSQTNLAKHNPAKIAKAEEICRKHIENMHTLIGGIYRKYFQKSGFGGGERQIINCFNDYAAHVLFNCLFENDTSIDFDIKSLLLRLFDCTAESFVQDYGDGQSVPAAIKTAIAADIRHKSGFTQYIADRIYDIYIVLQELLETRTIHKKNEVLGGIIAFAALQGVDIR